MSGTQDFLEGNKRKEDWPGCFSGVMRILSRIKRELTAKDVNLSLQSPNMTDQDTKGWPDADRAVDSRASSSLASENQSA